MRMGTRAGRQGTTGAKEQAVVAVVARKNSVSAELRSAQAGAYRVCLPLLCASQRLPAGLSGPGAAANPGVSLRSSANANQSQRKEMDLPRAESNEACHHPDC